MKALIQSILNLLVKFLPKPPPPPVPTPEIWHCVPAQEAWEELLACGLTRPTHTVRDSHFWSLQPDLMVDLIQEFFSGLPPYESITAKKPGWDCDKAAHAFVTFMYRHKINRVWEVWGDTPSGYHAWNVFGNEHGTFEVEPQTAEMWAFGENPSYHAKEWV